MNEWFAALPPEAQASVRPRFTSARRDAFLGAFYELYHHELALRGDYAEVDCDIGREDPDHIRPDLLLRRADKACYIEVTVALGDDVVDPAARPRVQQLYDAVNRISNRDFLLHVHVLAVGPGTPGRRLVREIDAWLSAMDPDAEIARVSSGGAPADTRIERDGWVVSLSAAGWKRSLRGRTDLGVIGSYVEGTSGHCHVVEGQERIEFDGPRQLDDSGLLAASLHRKLRHRYVLGGLPFVIAVLCAGDFVGDDEVIEALIGEGGLWGVDAPKRSTRLSGIMTATGLSPSAVAVVEPTLWINPAGEHPVPEDFFPWRTVTVSKTGRLFETRATRAAADVLNLSPHFPAS